MVAGIHEGALRDRIGMYWFDLHQQFGTAGVLLAVVGLTWILWPGKLTAGLAPSAPGPAPSASGLPPAVLRLPPNASRVLSRPRIGLALLLLFLVNWLFAFTYNVGDTHVFYLPSHFMVALFAGLGAGTLLSALRLPPSALRLPPSAPRLPPSAFRLLPIVLGLVLLAYPAWRAYDTFPALDRSHDWQVKEFFDRLTKGLNSNEAVLSADLNWQLHNGLDYYAKYNRPDLGVADTTGALLYFPLLVRSNREIGRAVAVTDGAAGMLTAAYGPLFDIERDARVPAPSFSERVGRFARGTPYVLALLEPYSDNPVDSAEIDAALGRLTGDTVRLESSSTAQPAAPVSIRFPGGAYYNVIAGRVGERPTVARVDSRPFRMSGRAGSVDVDIRIECWLPADTIRRMGFGRVIVGHAPALTLDRGASFVAFDENGGVKAVEYGWAILAPQPRWIIPVEPARSGTDSVR
jgi:hypothetical protein